MLAGNRFAVRMRLVVAHILASMRELPSSPGFWFSIVSCRCFARLKTV